MPKSETSPTADEVIANTLANWPRTVDAEMLKAELVAAGYRIMPHEPTKTMLTLMLRTTANRPALLNHLPIRKLVLNRMPTSAFTNQIWKRVIRILKTKNVSEHRPKIDTDSKCVRRRRKGDDTLSENLTLTHLMVY